MREDKVMWFTNNHRYNMQGLSATFLTVALLMGLLLLSTGCGGAGASQANNGGNGGGSVLFSAPATTPVQVWVGAEPTDRILTFRLSVTSIKLKNSTAAADLLPGASDLEFTRVEDAFVPVALPDVAPDTYDQLEMVVSGAHCSVSGCEWRSPDQGRRFAGSDQPADAQSGGHGGRNPDNADH